jgi:hypothetical protein
LAILEKYLIQNPGLRSVIFDRPEVIECVTSPRVSASQYASHCELIGGDFFDSLPADGDLYVFLSIFNDWSDDHCRLILRNCREAMPPSGRVVLIDPLIPAELNEPHFSKRLDVQMLLVHQGGRLRTEDELRALLHSVEFEVTRVVPTRTYLTIVEARPEQATESSNNRLDLPCRPAFRLS